MTLKLIRRAIGVYRVEGLVALRVAVALALLWFLMPIGPGKQRLTRRCVMTVRWSGWTASLRRALRTSQGR